MDEKERLEPFNIERTRKNMKEDFDKITTLDDLKDFFLQLLPKMMETDVRVVEALQHIKHVIEVVYKSEKQNKEEKEVKE